MVKPPTDPNPPPSQGGSPQITTADWNTLIADIYPHVLDSLANHNAQSNTDTVTVPIGSTSAFKSVTFPSSFGGSIPRVLCIPTAFGANVPSPPSVQKFFSYRGAAIAWVVPVADTDLFGDINYRLMAPYGIANGVTIATIRANITVDYPLSNTAFLGLAYSNDNGATWNDWIPATASGLDLGQLSTGLFSSAQTTAPASPTITGGSTIFRIHGVGDGTDSVTLASVEVAFLGSQVQGLAEVVPSSITTTAFTATARVNGKSSIAQNVTFTYLAFIP